LGGECAECAANVKASQIYHMVTRGGGDDVRGAHDGYNCGSMGGGVMILDNALATFTGSWNTGASSADKYGADYRWASTGVSTARAFWTPSITRAGDYEISMWWPAGSNRNPATQVGLLLNGRLFTASINQQLQGGQWNVLGTVPLPVGNHATIGLSNFGSAGWVVVADALRLVRQ